MNLSEFYDNVVLRDILEYTAPGAVVFVSLVVLYEATCATLGVNAPFARLILLHPWHVLIPSLFVSYVVGHILTGVHSSILREKEDELVAKVLSDNKWLKERLIEVVSLELKITGQEAETLLHDEKTAKIIRELGRNIVHAKAPRLYREFINRRSILARFCQNMVIAIMLSSVSLLVSVVVAGNALKAKVEGDIDLVVAVAMILLVLEILSVIAQHQRSIRLRENMARHTFEIWFIESLQLTSKEASPAGE